MIINTEIVDNYIKFNNLKSSNNHWIYSAITPGSIMFEEPKNIPTNDIVEVKNEIIKILEDFNPINDSLWKQIFNSDGSINENQEVLIIVGLPEPYDAVVRPNLDGDNVIVFDVVRLIKYGNLERIIPAIVTHEVAHILIDKKFNLYKEDLDTLTKLKQLMFDEGFAHYLTFENIQSMDMEDDDMKLKRANAFRKLKEVVQKEITEDILDEGNSGAFWEKYIAISGFFVIVQYMRDNGDITKLFNQGYEYFWTYWSELATSRINFV